MSTEVMTANRQARQKNRIAIPTCVPLVSFQEFVKQILSNHANAPIVKAIWVTLIENMENTANVYKEN